MEAQEGLRWSQMSRIKNAGKEIHKRRGWNNLGVTAQGRIPAPQTALQAKQCFIHANAVTQKKVQSFKAVRAIAQLFIK